MCYHEQFHRGESMSRRRKNRVRRIRRRIRVICIMLGLVFLLWISKTLIRDTNYDKSNEHTSIIESEESVHQQSETNISDVDDTNPIINKLNTFARNHQFSVNEYPSELVELLLKNPDTEEFVLNYPLKKNTFSKEKLTELEEDKIPLLMQWDSRWGYYKYGDNVMGLTGCGPTCLSMVASYLLQNPALTPIYMAEYATRNGYSVSGSGTSWNFMSEGATELGLHVKEVPLMENKIKNYLQQGYPIICILGPGEFTDNGHFIVLTGVEDDKIRLNDPNSRERSERMWEYEELKNQIRNIWVYQVDY